MKQSYDVAVIGGGPGGYTAALYCARAGLSTLVLEKLSPGGQMATASLVENYPGFDQGIDGFELGQRMQQGAERFGAETEYAEVTGLEVLPAEKRLLTTGGPVRAKAVILATGAVPRLLGLPGEKELTGRGVAYCAACDGMAFKGKTVAVAGGGNSAVTEALTLSAFCQKVYLIHRRDSLRADPVYAKALEQSSNLQFIRNSRIAALLYDDRLRGLRLQDTRNGQTRELSCDGLFVAIGRQPDTALLAGQAKLDPQGYLVADETTRTSLPGLFAVGDVRTKPLRQIITAASDGAVASRFAAEYIHSLEQVRD